MKLKLTTLLLILSSAVFAQTNHYNFGARSNGMGGASVTVADPYSVFNNIGGLARVTETYVFAGYQHKFNFQAFQVMGAGATYNTPYGTAGLGFFRTGAADFSNQRINLAFGHKLQMVSLGVGVDVIQYSQSTFGNATKLAIQFGGIAEIIPQLRFGAHIYNINQAKISDSEFDNIPTTMKAGASYRPIDGLMVNVEVEKELHENEIIRAGVEFKVVDRVFLRAGISSEPVNASFGVGFYPKDFKIDYAFSNNTNLGGIHEFSVAYRLNLNKKETTVDSETSK